MGEYTLPIKDKTQKSHISPQPCPELSLTATLSRKGHWESSLNFGWPYAQLKSQSSWKEEDQILGKAGSLCPEGTFWRLLSVISLSSKVRCKMWSYLSFSVVEIWDHDKQKWTHSVCALVLPKVCDAVTLFCRMGWTSLPPQGFALSDAPGLDGNVIQMEC